MDVFEIQFLIIISLYCIRNIFFKNQMVNKDFLNKIFKNLKNKNFWESSTLSKIKPKKWKPKVCLSRKTYVILRDKCTSPKKFKISLIHFLKNFENFDYILIGLYKLLVSNFFNEKFNLKKDNFKVYIKLSSIVLSP